MKKYLLLFTLIVCSRNVNAQDSTRISKVEWMKFTTRHKPHENVYQYVAIMTNGDTIVADDKLKLGKGTMPNGDYQFIATPSNTNEAKLKRTTKLQEIEITEILKKGKEKYGYKYIFKCQGNYLLQLESAIATGEVRLQTENSAKN